MFIYLSCYVVLFTPVTAVHIKYINIGCVLHLPDPTVILFYYSTNCRYAHIW